MDYHKILKPFWWLVWLAACLFACSGPAYIPRSATPSPTPSQTPTLPQVAPTRLRPTLTQSPAPKHTATPTRRPSPTVSPAAPGEHRLIGYFYGLDRNNSVADIPAGKLTDLIYAFIDVSDAGNCVEIDPSIDAADFPALQRLKQQNPALHLLVSIGGYSHSARFSDAAATDAARQVFAQSCVQFMQANGFDGIDIDWETPVSGGQAGNSHRPEDKQNYTALMAALRNQLDAQGKKDGKLYLLSVAVPAGPNVIGNFAIKDIYPYVDWMTVMAYAFYTSDSQITNFNAPLYASSTDPATNEKKRLLYNGDAAIKAYLAVGAPADKLSLGVPFYGRAWKGVASDNDGLYQSDTGPFADPSAPKGTWTRDGEITYKALKQYYLGKWPRFWQSQAQEPWLYNSDDQVMVTYDDPQSLAAKADYARSNQLGGISIWQVSGDDDQHSLVDTLYSHLLR